MTEKLNNRLEPEVPQALSQTTEPQAHPDIGEDVNVATIAAVGLVTTIIVLVVVMLLVGLYYKTERGEEERKFTGLNQVTRQELAVQQVEKLGSYDWVDVDNGIVSIPIEQAMAITAAELALEQETERQRAIDYAQDAFDGSSAGVRPEGGAGV